MLGQWASTRAIHHALTVERELPPASKQEAENPKTDWGKIAKYRAWREEHDHEFSQALQSPKHFGAWLGMPDVLGEPPAETVKTLAEVKAEEAERNKQLPEESKLYFLEDSILAKAAREGRGFSPARSDKD